MVVKSRVMDIWNSHWCDDCVEDDDDEFSLSSVDWWWQRLIDIGTAALTARDYMLYRMPYPAAETENRLKKKLMVDHEFYPRISMLLWRWWKRIKRNDALSAFVIFRRSLSVGKLV